MSHGRSSVPAPEGEGRTPLAVVQWVFDRVRRHVAEWPRRYVEMRVGERRF